MKNRRRISLLCAIAMSLTLALPAGAASLSDPLQPSDFTGETITCQEVVGSFSSEETTSYLLEVPIPGQATKAQQNQLITSAISSVQKNRQNSPPLALQTIYTNDTPFTLVSSFFMDMIQREEGNPPQTKNTITLAETYKTLIVMFYELTPINNATEVYANITSGDVIYRTPATAINYADVFVYMIADTGGAGNLSSGSSLRVQAATNRGGASMDKCEIQMSYYDYSAG